MKFSIEQKLDLGWLDLVSSSRSWESSSFLTRDCLPWEMSVFKFLLKFQFIAFAFDIIKLFFNAILYFGFLIRYSSRQGCQWLLDWSWPCSSSWKGRILSFNFSFLTPPRFLLPLCGLCNLWIYLQFREQYHLEAASSLLRLDRHDFGVLWIYRAFQVCITQIHNLKQLNQFNRM